MEPRRQRGLVALWNFPKQDTCRQQEKQWEKGKGLGPDCSGTDRWYMMLVQDLQCSEMLRELVLNSWKNRTKDILHDIDFAMRPLLALVGRRHEMGGRGSLQLPVRMMHDMDLKQTCRVYMTTSKRTQILRILWDCCSCTSSGVYQATSPQFSWSAWGPCTHTNTSGHV